MTAVEAIPTETLREGLPWDWVSFPDYLDALDRLPKGLNIAGYIGHSALRSYVMGDAAFERASNDDELAAMHREMRAAMPAVDFGLEESGLRGQQPGGVLGRQPCGHVAGVAAPQRQAVQPEGVGPLAAVADGHAHREDPGRREVGVEVQHALEALLLEPLHGALDVVDPQADVVERRRMHRGLFLRIERLHQVDLDLGHDEALLGHEHADHARVRTDRIVELHWISSLSAKVLPEFSCAARDFPTRQRLP